MSEISQLSALQILHKTAVVTFSDFVILAIEDELIPDIFISSFFVNPLSIRSFHNLYN